MLALPLRASGKPLGVIEIFFERHGLAGSPPLWQKLTLANPVVYLVNGFRWSFFGRSDVRVEVSLGMTLGFLVLCLATVRWLLRSGYRLKS